MAKIHEMANAMTEQFREILSINEYNYIKRTVTKKKIPSICLLIKDHKKMDDSGNFPTRLVVPAKNFTVGSPHM